MLGEYIGAGSGTTKLLLHLNGSSADSSGNGNNVTDTAITYVDGKFGKCASFNGSSSKIVGSGQGLGLDGGTVTISIWAKASSGWNIGTNYCALFFQQNNNTKTAFSISLDYINPNRRIYFGRTRRNIVGQEVAVNRDISDQYFENFILTYNSSTQILRGYINGSLVGTTTSVTGNGSGTIATGWTMNTYFEGSAQTYFNGLIDEVTVEPGKEWSAAEVAKYYTYAQGRYATL